MSQGPVEEPPGEPPVIARLLVEIRSDGTRTIARGAIADELNGQQLAIEARGTSLLNVALQLAGQLTTRLGGLRDQASAYLPEHVARPRKRDRLVRMLKELSRAHNKPGS